jgi:hypothetical protein
VDESKAKEEIDNNVIALKIQMTKDMWRNLFDEDWLERSLFYWEQEVCFY